MKISIVFICLMGVLATSSVNSEPHHNWQANGGQLKLFFFYDLLNDFDVQVNDGLINRKKGWSNNELNLPIREAGGLSLFVPYDGLKAVNGGQLLIDGKFSWVTEAQQIMFENMHIRPVTRPLKAGELTALEIVNDREQVLFYLDHIHAGFNKDKSWVMFNNMDLRVSADLADRLGQPHLNNFVVGHAHMNNNVSIPIDYSKDEDYILGGCTPGDNWPADDNQVDVTLVEMSAQFVRSIGAEHAVFTPSATLENEGQADVAWYRKFTGEFEPYRNDQHPYLNWSMYREIDGRFEQIGVSGVKHAFYTVNTVCPCAGGQVLFPGCRDTYSVGNNDSPSHLGPRDEISTFDGNWVSTGSFFDQNSDGVQDNDSNLTDENRMVVAEIDFSDRDLDYYISAWYIIKDDIDIYNSMGYRGYEITPNRDGWITTATSGFNQGPASDQYVTPNTLDLINQTASTRILQVNEGHLTVAVKVIDLGEGLYRYNYMVENLDYDPQVKSVYLPLGNSSSFSNFVFSDVDEELSNDWTVSHENNQLVLHTPVGNEIDWGTLYSFSFTTDAPIAVGNIGLSGSENDGIPFTAELIVPEFNDVIFVDGFESLN